MRETGTCKQHLLKRLKPTIDALTEHGKDQKGFKLKDDCEFNWGKKDPKGPSINDVGNWERGRGQKLVKIANG